MAAIESTANLPRTLAKVDAEHHLVEGILVDAPVKANPDDSGTVSSNEPGVSKQIDGPVFVSITNDAEPIVTRKELWSYYRAQLNT
jgi:hypothetical protein